MDLKALLKKANSQLGYGYMVVRRNKLRYNAVLPPKRGETEPKRREIALNCAFTKIGIETALLRAQQIEAQLVLGLFRWPEEQDPLTVAQGIELLHDRFWRSRSKSEQQKQYWQQDWLVYLRRLPLEEELTPRLLRQVAATYKPNSKSRLRACVVYAALAKEAGMSVDFSDLKGSYSPKEVDTRRLPSDEEIVANRNLLPRPEWQWVYTVMATYGLRNHEVFYVDWSTMDGDGIVYLSEGKTGGRLLYPMPPKGLVLEMPPMLPCVTGKTHKDYGDRVSHYFRRYGIRPYDLRHCYARRMFEQGFNADFVAKAMGHSLSVHMSVYRRFWGDEPYKRLFKERQCSQSPTAHS